MTATIAAAAELYANRLRREPRALGYLASRGFNQEALGDIAVGYAAGDELVRYLNWRGMPVAVARRAGLLDPLGRERLAGRIVFPEFRQGRAVWLIGRQLDDMADGPRYLGLPGAKPVLGLELALRDRCSVQVVEGPFDLLVLRRWGYNVVALCGTGFGPAVTAELKRWERIYAVLDNDEAGREATARLLGTLGSRVVPVQLPAAIKDPAELARHPNGHALFARALQDTAA